MSSADRPAAAASAIVIGMSGSTGLAVVRALSAAGVTCHAVHYERGAPAMTTRLARTYVSQDWREHPEALTDFLVHLAMDLRKGDRASLLSLFVCHDAALQPVWAGRERLLEVGLRPAFSAARPLNQLLDKRTQLEAAAAAGVATPWTRWGPAADLLRVADECPYPAILKPAVSHLGVKALGAKALRCTSAAELRPALERAAGVDVMLQEFIPGGDEELYTAGVFRWVGGHVAFTGRKLKQHPPGLGIARLAESVVRPELVPGSVALLEQLGYEGISQVEYKRDARDGSYRLMEANFRPWTWLGLATACGMNLPLAAHRWAIGEASVTAAGDGRTRKPVDRGAPRRWVWVVPEAVYTVRDLRRGVLPPLWQWRGLRAEAYFSRRDPVPFLHAVTAGLRPRARGLHRLARRGLGGVAFAINAVTLAADWVGGGRRSVTGALPRKGLPPAGPLLVVAPHPDDETIMAGATMAAAARRGDRVRVVGITAGVATEVGVGAYRQSDIGAVRAAEQRAAAAALGVGEIDLWDFADRGVAADRERLARQLYDAIQDVHPVAVIAPFPYDAHLDHVAAAAALADALARLDTGRGAPSSPVVLCAAVQTPLSPCWVTRLVPAGETWRSRETAVRAYASRGRGIFAKSTQLARLHPASWLRPAEWFVELPAAAFVRLVRALDEEGLTMPRLRPRGHPLAVSAELVLSRPERLRIGAVLSQCLSDPGLPSAGAVD